MRAVDACNPQEYRASHRNSRSARAHAKSTSARMPGGNFGSFRPQKCDYHRRKNLNHVRESRLDVRGPSRVNQYRMVKRKPIGEGWQSKVYLVEDTNTQRQYALKELKLKRMDKVIRRAKDSQLMADDDDDGDTSGSAWVEVSVGKILRHKNIVPLVEVITDDDDSIFLAMELQQGGELMRRKEAKRFSLPHARRAMRDVMRGLAHMHAQGVVHRDIKCDNCLVALDGTVKLCDFGMAHIIEPGGDDSLSCAIGARKYRAPELFDKGKRYSGFLADVWAAGCVFYALVAGNCPFESKSKRELVHMILHRPVPITKRLGREPALKDLLLKMLAKKPRDRTSLQDALSHRWMMQG